MHMSINVGIHPEETTQIVYRSTDNLHWLVITQNYTDSCTIFLRDGMAEKLMAALQEYFDAQAQKAVQETEPVDDEPNTDANLGIEPRYGGTL